MKKKRKLRKWVKITITIIIMIIVAMLFAKGCERWARWGEWCDAEKGYTCSIKEVQDYARKLSK